MSGGVSEHYKTVEVLGAGSVPLEVIALAEHTQITRQNLF
jgi:hypothetical protein